MAQISQKKTLEKIIKLNVNKQKNIKLEICRRDIRLRQSGSVQGPRLRRGHGFAHSDCWTEWGRQIHPPQVARRQN